MPEKPLPIEKLLSLLEEHPQRIATASEHLPPSGLHTPSSPDEWSANDVLAHLRSCADVWGDCIAAIIAQDNPTLKAVNPRTWIKQTDYLEQEFQPSFHVFVKQRTELLAVLKPLAIEGWLRSATVLVAGKPLERSVHSYAQWLATHERSHVKQIERIVKTMHN
jgi:hypothetical protein